MRRCSTTAHDVINPFANILLNGIPLYRSHCPQLLERTLHHIHHRCRSGDHLSENTHRPLLSRLPPISCADGPLCKTNAALAAFAIAFAEAVIADESLSRNRCAYKLFTPLLRMRIPRKSSAIFVVITHTNCVWECKHSKLTHTYITPTLTHYIFQSDKRKHLLFVLTPHETPLVQK